MIIGSNRTGLLDGAAVNAIASDVCKLDCSERETGEVTISFEADPGLYQFSVISDASRFDWESLYVDLFAYGNSGQRTGPWDFHPTEGARALLPSYWASLDGKELGLWYFQRVSTDDLKHRRFRGRLAFYVGTSGKHRLTLLPYRPVDIAWTSALLEIDPDDRIGEVPETRQDWFDRCPLAVWRKPLFRERLSANLRESHRQYEEPLRHAFGWLKDPRNRKPETLPLLIGKAILEQDEASLEQALEVIDRTVRAEHWGNPKPDGYGYDGDMGAMYAMWALVFAYHALYDTLDEERKSTILVKLTVQGDRFFDKILLYRDYWGGSVLQDHGWRSMFGFGSAVLHLLGVIPQARLWASYVIPRLERSLAAMPADGVIPSSSHYTLHLYTDMVGHYRDALLGLTGKDLYAGLKFRRIVDYLAATLHEPDMMLVGWGRDRIHLVGGSAFLNAMASVHGDRRAAYIQNRLLDKKLDSFYAEPEEMAYYNSVLWGLLSYDGTAEPADQIERSAAMHVWEDSGVVHYRDPDGEVVLSVKSGPPLGYNAYRRADGPCDRLGLGPDAGHFMIAVKGRPLLVTPDGGYRLSTDIRSCLLIGGNGQRDNIGYPMSVPSYRYAGEDIRSASWSEAAERGRIRLDLAAAYPDEAGIAVYTREFFVEKGKPIRMRDHIVLDEPQQLIWLFQTKRENGLRIEARRSELGGTANAANAPGAEGAGGLVLTCHVPDLTLNVSVAEAPVVWSYVSTNDFKPFDTIRYETAKAVRAAVVDFMFTPVL